MSADQAPIARISARAYTIPTDAPEADGTLEWDSTTLVVAEATAGGITGLGYTYAASARVIADTLAPPLLGEDAFAVPRLYERMVRQVRNIGSAKAAIGVADLMIDANGALTRKQALAFAEAAAEFGVSWFEEPVSSDDLDGLRLVRDRAPSSLEIAAGEYGYEPFYFKRMMDVGAVDVLQADATRCCGYTGFLKAATLCDAAPLPLSAHTAPALHLPVCLSAPRLRHTEWFHDHVRIEGMLFDGAPAATDGVIRPDLSRPGHGLAFKRADAERFAV